VLQPPSIPADRIDAPLAGSEASVQAPATATADARNKRRQRIRAAALVMVLSLVTLSGLGAVGYVVGRNTESDLRFFEPRRPPTLDEIIIASPIEYALHSDERNDVIFLGDSTCFSGVDPKRFEQLTHLRAYNLGSQGSIGALGFLITGKAYLSRHPRPQAVVLCVTPIAFEGSIHEISERMGSTFQNRFEANYGPEVPGLVPPIQSITYFIKRGALATWAATATCFDGRRADVRDMLVARGLSYRMYHREIHDLRGYGRSPAVHGKTTDMEGLGRPVQIEPEWDHSVRLLAETCREMGIPLLIRFTPMASDYAHLKDYSPVERWAYELEASCPGVTVGRPILLWFDPSVCFDFMHLNDAGVSAYMPVLAQAVQAVIRSDESRTGH
jgi:hypothetical protein